MALELYSTRRPGLERSRSELAAFIPRRHRRIDGTYAYNEDWDDLDDDLALSRNGLWLDDGWSHSGSSTRSPRSSALSNSHMMLSFSDPAWSTADVFGCSARSQRSTTVVPIPRISSSTPAFADGEVYIFPTQTTAVRVRLGGDGKAFVARMGDVSAEELLHRVAPANFRVEELALYVVLRDRRCSPVRLKDENRIKDVVRDYGGTENVELIVARKQQRERRLYESARGGTEGSRGRWRWETV